MDTKVVFIFLHFLPSSHNVDITILIVLILVIISLRMMFKEVKLFYFDMQIHKYETSNLTVTVDMFLHSSIYLTHKAYKQLIILAATKT